MEKDLLTEKIIGCCYVVHNELGPGFIEKIYHRALITELKRQKVNFETEKEYNVFYNDDKVGSFRCDLVIEDLVVVELKSVNGILPLLFQYKVLSYLKASKLKTGLLINFGNQSCQIKRLSL